MKALSIRQPWAWAMLHGKDVENRTWSTNHRGPFLIHAAWTFDEEGYHWIRENQDKLNLTAPLPAIEDFQRGGIIGRSNLLDCVTDHPSPWFSGPKGFVHENPESLPFHPCPGKPGFFEVEVPY